MGMSTNLVALTWFTKDSQTLSAQRCCDPPRTIHENLKTFDVILWEVGDEKSCESVKHHIVLKYIVKEFFFGDSNIILLYSNRWRKYFFYVQFFFNILFEYVTISFFFILEVMKVLQLFLNFLFYGSIVWDKWTKMFIVFFFFKVN